MKKSEIKEIEPWGVNIPFIFLAIAYWALGSLSLPLNWSYHPYFMMLGAYALYFGMIQRLFFPAKNYLALHIASLIFLAIPIYYFQIIASVALAITEVKALLDLRNYGYNAKKLPINALVLSSPFASIITWLLYPNYWLLITPLLLYILGVNVGVFSVNLRTRPVFGLYQLPIFLIIISSYFFPILFPFIGVVYFLTIYRKTFTFKNTSAISSLLSLIVIPLLSLYFGDFVHAFTLGIMSTLFFSCITYSTSRYNYDKIVISIILSDLAYILRFFYFKISGIFWVIAVLYFLYLIRDNFYLTSIKLGLSMRFIRMQKESHESP
ncbi:conserved hypothetical protein [Sulfolobus islandicus Y.G.57.14]|jgi:hypothetical protein|uniref:Uncharacterized protein n=3 Tax=Saccharolobus islandicus TaxID=43080 RepID=C3NAF6_SACI7|nr:hypothetical protein [Sulfolobus islandicus]ACP46749.1 conserved hypothetical protein [Sulfolobus islandicus Y.G.57.14]ACP47560.1 conserved hypothetical protein [Sulfolobus islandicus Y.N.15.51]ADB88289.1 conserved hypothetical protein [Sulfolobus islandicus L.D.8.5]